LELDLSQEQLGEALGVTFQQIQKYERGTNRIGASRLFELGGILNVAVGYFYSGLAVRLNGADQLQPGAGLEEDAAPYVADPPQTRDEIELQKLFSQIKDPRARRAILDMCRSMVASRTDGSDRTEAK
jgi:transcriptional regulator with XRE-family HTH domain